MSNVPASLKPIAHYIKIANENANRDPIVYYWCLFYAVQTGMKIDRNSPDALKYLTSLLSTLETIKKQLGANEAITSEVVAQAHIENYSMKLFEFADKKEKAGQIDKSVVHAFYTAGHVMDILALFGEIDETYAQAKKYAKWKSTQIFACLRDGTPYVPSSQQPEGGEDLNFPSVPGGSNFGTNEHTVGGSGTGGYPNAANPFGTSSHSSSNSLQDHQGGGGGYGSSQPSAGGQDFGLPSVPGLPGYSASSGYSAASGYSASSGAPPPPSYTHTPPPLPPQPSMGGGGGHGMDHYSTSSLPASSSAPKVLGGEPTFDEFEQARKYIKYALSAVDYEDTKTTMDNLRKAMGILEKYVA